MLTAVQLKMQVRNQSHLTKYGSLHTMHTYISNGKFKYCNLIKNIHKRQFSPCMCCFE